MVLFQIQSWGFFLFAWLDFFAYKEFTCLLLKSEVVFSSSKKEFDNISAEWLCQCQGITAAPQSPSLFTAWNGETVEDMRVKE